jgi:hypothetical protein
MRVLLAICAVLGACGPHKSTGDDPATAKLSIDPPTSELLITNGAPGVESFTATLTYANGHTEDVTADTTFTIDTEYGTFSAATLTMQVAGKTAVYGAYGMNDATAEVIARLKDIRVDPGVPTNAPDWFTSATENPQRAPAIKYPPADVIMPRNVGDFEVHWSDASTNDVFEVSLKTDYADVRAYVHGGNGVAAGGPDPSYMSFLSDEWGAAVGTSTLAQVQVRGIDSTNPTVVGSAPAQNVNLSNEAMNGGLYYWASAGTEPEGIYRHDMSKPGQPAEAFMTTQQLTGSSYTCVACHGLSRDGKKMAITYQGGDGQATLIDVATSVRMPVAVGGSCTASSQCSAGMYCMSDGTCQTAWNFSTFTPDAAQILTVHDGQLVVRDSATLATLTAMAATGWVTQPDLSPDGTKLVYVHPNANTGISDWSFDGGSIYMRTYDQSTMAFGPEQQLLSDGNNNYYPTFSPDSQWVLFNKAPIGGSAYNNANASLWVVKADNSVPAVQLATSNQAAGLTNSWGRWAPFAQSFGTQNEPMFWVTVSSKRDFGVRLVGVKQPQIWMTPFFPDRASAQQDPSAASFRLPFQDIATNNHIAQWTEQVVVTQ